MWRGIAVLGLLVCLSTLTAAQDNASPKIPDHLIECYSNQSIYHRENRLPMTLRTLLDLLRKIEASPSGSNMNAREIAASLQYYLRMDGIQPSPVSIPDQSITPFAAMGDEFFRHRLMLVRLLTKPSQPNYLFLTENLSKKEMCNLHFMLSYSTDTTKRIDEQCGNIEQEAYAGRRFGRAANLQAIRRRREAAEAEAEAESKESKEAEDKNVQVEILPPDVGSKMEEPIDQQNETDKNSDFRVGNEALFSNPYDGPLRGGISRSSSRIMPTYDAVRPAQKKAVRGMVPSYDSQRYIPNVERSQCPVENGVILTPFGSVTIGAVIAGITAGLQRQNIAPRDMGVLANELKPELANARVDNVWATTLAGDLADLILAVGNIGADVNSAVGLKGGWNNTIAPKWYLLQNDNPAYVTDAQLRGALDGLWLGKNVKTWVDRVNTLKLSQILDLYYSQQGVPGTGVQACNRRTSFSSYAPDNEFNQQLELFSVVMQKQRVNSATINDFTSLVQNVMTNVQSYVPNFDSGSQCSSINAGQESSPNDFSLNLVVVIDNSWPPGALNDILTILVDKEVVATPYMSNTTIMCGRDGKILYQGNSAVSFGANFTTTTLNTCASGMDLVTSLNNLEVTFRQLYEQERMSSRVNKGAYAVLLLPYSQSTTQNSTGLWDKRHMFNVSMPDVKFLVATNGPKDAFKNMVDDVNTDAFTVRAPNSKDQSSIEQVKAIATRLQGIPQRLSYPQCGSYYDAAYGRGTLTDNVRVGYTKFYRLHPNYFYSVTNPPKVSVRSSRGATLSVCVSRTDPTPTGTVSSGVPGGPGNNPNYEPKQNPGYPQNPIYPPNAEYPQNPQDPQNYGGWNRNPQTQWRQQSNSWSSAYSSMDRQTSSDVKCVSVNQAASDLPLPENPCYDYDYISSCPPIYISVSSPLSSDIPPSQCYNDCRLPTNAEYEINLENLSCNSGAAELLVHPLTVLLTTLLLIAATLTQ